MITKVKGYGAWERVDPAPGYPSCTGPCQQGRFPCGTPEACRVLHEPGPEDGLGLGVFKWALYALAAWAIIITAWLVLT